MLFLKYTSSEVLPRPNDRRCDISGFAGEFEFAKREEHTMRDLRISILLPLVVGLVTGGAVATAAANEELAKIASDSKNWAMQTGDYANTRFSKLKQITKDNAKNLEAKWTFSTVSAWP